MLLVRHLLDRMGSVKMRRKLLLSYLLVFLLPMTFIGYDLVNSMTGVALNYTMQIRKSNMDQIKINVENIIDKYDLISDEILLDHNLLAYLNNVYEGDYSSMSQSYQQNELTSQYKSKMVISSPDARYRIYSDNPMLKPNDLFYMTGEREKEAGWYKDIVAAGGYNILGSSYFNPEWNRWEFTIGRVLVSDFNDEGTTNVLRIDIPEESLYEFIQKGSDSEEIYLFDSRNVLISASANREYIGRPMSHIPGLEERMQKDKGAEEVLTADFSKVRTMKGWRLVVLVSNQGILRDLGSIVNRSLLVCIISFGVAFVLMLFFSNTLSGRLKRLVHNMANIREGSLEVSVTDHRNDEIGELTRSFRKMVDRINTLIHEGYEKELGMKNLAIEKRDAELHALQSQINPHFLFNTMDAIRMHLVKKGDRETAEIMSNFAKLFRRSLDWSSNLVPLARELEFVDSYLRIFRFRRKLEYRIEVDPRLLGMPVPKFLLQPLVENAIQHGVEPRKEAGYIRIEGTIAGDEAVLAVIDNGAGMTEEQLDIVRRRLSLEEPEEGSRSIGLLNVKQRVRSQFGEDYGLEIDSRVKEQTKVSLRIPYAGEGETDVQRAGSGR